MKNRPLSILLLIGTLLTGCGELKPMSQNSESISLTFMLMDMHHKPVQDAVISNAITDCRPRPLLGGEDGKTLFGEMYPDFPLQWCNVLAANLPISTDKNGKAVLKFFLTPPPSGSKLHSTESLEYNMPMLHWQSGKNDQTGMTKLNGNLDWQMFGQIP